MKVVDFTDYEGIPHRVALPEGESIPPEEGLKISLDLDMLFSDLPAAFRQQFYLALWQVGLIEPCDYLRPGASDLFRRALNSAIRTDFYQVLAMAKETCKKRS